MVKIQFFLMLIFILLKFNETCETDKYPPLASTMVKTVTLNLDLPPEERWRDIAIEFKDEVIIFCDILLIKSLLYQTPFLDKKPCRFYQRVCC